MGAGQAQVLAQELHEERPRSDISRRGAAVHRHRDMNHSHILLNQGVFVVDACGVARACGDGEGAERAALGDSTAWAAMDWTDGSASPAVALDRATGLASPASAAPLAATATKLEKNLSAMFFATPSMRREPSWAILPP